MGQTDTQHQSTTPNGASYRTTSYKYDELFDYIVPSTKFPNTSACNQPTYTSKKLIYKARRKCLRMFRSIIADDSSVGSRRTALTRGNCTVHRGATARVDSLLSGNRQGRNFGLKSGGTNSEGERGALGFRGERGGE